MQTETTPKAKKQREGGIELLRIFAIFLITCVHMLNFGGFLGHAASDFELSILRLLYAFFMIAVNIFVIITGFFYDTFEIPSRKTYSALV